VIAMTTYWFRQKRFGYGGTPVTWQGWLLVLVFVAFVAGCVLLVTFAARHGLAAGALGAIVLLSMAIAALIYVSWRKTEGGWRWHWGNE
jgi:hypothetical protein